ncbi:hypothetical protein ACA910_002183 [Epithemia clementina (nom. ined.)]
MDNTILGMDFGDDDHLDVDPDYNNNADMSSSNDSLHFDTEDQPDSGDELHPDAQLEYDEDQVIPLYNTDDDMQDDVADEGMENEEAEAVGHFEAAPEPIQN